MKGAKYRWAFIAIAVLHFLFYSCSSMRSVAFSESLRQDTVSYSGNGNYLGPFYIKMGEPRADHNIQHNLFSVKEESQDVFSFSICGKNDCANAESYFYTKTKNSYLLSGKNGNVSRVKAEKLYGSIRYSNQDTMSFMVDVGGKHPGKGFLTLPGNNIITIASISKKSAYGKRAYGVGLEFKRDGRVIGAFIQSKELIEVVINKEETDRMKIILSALAISLVNRSNEIRIL